MQELNILTLSEPQFELHKKSLTSYYRQISEVLLNPWPQPFHLHFPFRSSNTAAG